jgi:hypothetical protein
MSVSPQRIGSPAIGIRLPNSGPLAAPAAILDVALLSEALGFDTVWVHDHLAWPSDRRTHFAAGSVEAVRDQPPDFFESLSVLAFLAGATRRIRLGVARLVLPWRDARVLAKQLATIHEASGRRLVVGAAIGRFEDEFQAQQVPYRERGRITDEHLAWLTLILGPSAVTTFQGGRTGPVRGGRVLSRMPRVGRQDAEGDPDRFGQPDAVEAELVGAMAESPELLAGEIVPKRHAEAFEHLASSVRVQGVVGAVGDRPAAGRERTCRPTLTVGPLGLVAGHEPPRVRPHRRRELVGSDALVG